MMESLAVVFLPSFSGSNLVQVRVCGANVIGVGMVRNRCLCRSV